MKKLKVNTEGCIGCGACVALDPEHFDFNEEGLSIVKNEENINPEKIQEVVEVCPVSVISYEETDEECDCDQDCHCCNDTNKECHCNEDEDNCKENEKAA